MKTWNRNSKAEILPPERYGRIYRVEASEPALPFVTRQRSLTSREHCLDLVLQIGADAFHRPFGVDEVEAVVALHTPEGVAHAALVLQEAIEHVARQA